MKETLIIEIEAEHDVADLCDVVGGRIWTMLNGKREVEVRIASAVEKEALAFAALDHAHSEANGKIEKGAQYGY